MIVGFRKRNIYPPWDNFCAMARKKKRQHKIKYLYVTGRRAFLPLRVLVSSLYLYGIVPFHLSQCAEKISNKIANPFNKNYTGWKSVIQGFQIYFAGNPRLKGIESSY